MPATLCPVLRPNPLQVHLSYRVSVPGQNAFYRMRGYDWRPTSFIQIISSPLLCHSRAGNETTELLDTELVVQDSPDHKAQGLGVTWEAQHVPSALLQNF